MTIRPVCVEQEDFWRWVGICHQKQPSTLLTCK